MPYCYNIQNTDKRYFFQDSANKGLVQEIAFLVFHRCLYDKQNITWLLVVSLTHEISS